MTYYKSCSNNGRHCRRDELTHGVQMRPGPELRIILIITGINTFTAKDGDLRLSAPNACLPKTEISVFVTECVLFTSTCYELHVFTLHDVLYSYKEEMFPIILV